MKKRILSILLAVCLVITMFPITALSLEEDGSASTVQYTVLESSGGNAGETSEKLFDGNTGTKWCVKTSGTLYVIFQTDSPVNVSGYDITTANDNASNRGRNPKSWTLYGCNDYAADGVSSWVSLHSVTDDTVLQDVNYTKYSYVFEKETTAYQYYKLEITANQGADVMQMSEFTLTFCDHVWNIDSSIPVTCTEDGYTEKTCTVCNNSVRTVIPKLGHNFSAETGICENCGLNKNYLYDISEGRVTVRSDENNPGMIKVTYGDGQIIDNIDPATVLTVTGSTTTNEFHIVTDIPVTIRAKDLTIDCSGKDYAYAMLVAGSEDRGKVTLILEGTNTFNSGKEKAGICVGEGRTLIIEGDGSLNAVGGNFGGAGIGGEVRNTCGTVIINSGTVTATGKDGGAGIGGGSKFSGVSGGGGAVIINGGTVTANGSNMGSDIGGGSDNTNGIFIMLGGTVTATNGKIVGTSGIKVNEDGNYEVYGALTLPADITIPEGKTLVIPSGTTLTVPDGVTLTTNSTVMNNGTIENNGTINNYGTVYNTGTVTGTHYAVSFDLNGGNGSAVTQCFFNTDVVKVVEPAKPTKDGYLFDGWYNGETKYDFTAVVTESMTLTAKWVSPNVSNEAELKKVLELGGTFISLANNVTLSSILDLTDKIITLDLNGHTLKGNIRLADSSAAPKSILTLIDSDPAAGGVVNGNITLTRGSGSASHLYANGGTITGQVSMPSYAGGIFCTSDTPTVFKGYVGNYGEIHGGLFYGNVNESCIREKTVTFMNGSSRYALQVVADGSKTVAPVKPTKSGCVFLGWYNGETEYTFGSTISESITLVAKWKDLAAPTGEISIGTNKWTGILNDITFGLFFKDTQTVTITASDNSGDAVTIEYLLSNKGLTADELAAASFTAYTEAFSINPDNAYVIYAKLTDTSGNVTYLSSDGIVLDATAPVISGVENGKTYCEAQTVTVTEKYIASVTVNGNPVLLDENNQFALSPAEGTQTIVVTDSASNETSVTVTVNDGHTPEADDGDCTTPIVCTVCGVITTPAMSHDFEWQSDDTYHWHQCQNAGCNQTDEKVAIAPERIEATIANAEYLLDTTVNPKDITVTAYYSDGFSETVTTFTTDIDDIDMSTVGSKTITVSLTKNGGTCTDDITINVIEDHHNYFNGVCTGCGSYEPPELKNGVYQIKNYANLYWFAALVNGTLTDGTAQNTSANAVLVNDITVNSIANTGNYLEWTPIGNSDNRYEGTFDGQGHKIIGLYFNDASADYVGLFGYLLYGTIRNVGVVGSYFNGKNSVGGVCGHSYGTIENCYNTSTANGVSNVGGIVGVNFGGEIRNCYNTGAISASNYGAGGIAGYNYYATIMNCYSSAAISAPTDVGGICGASDYGTVNNCYHNSKYFKGASVGRYVESTLENVSAKTATQFTSGEVAYLLSNGVTDGTQAWYQTLGTDGYPTLDNTHGTVYCNASYPGCVGAPGTPAYTYENIARDTELPPHNFVDGICTICGAKQHIVIVEEDLHAEGLVLGANTAADCKAELNTAEMYVVIKNMNSDALSDSDLVGTGATITYYDRTTNAAVKTVTVVLYGDVNGDGLCDTTDYTILKDASNANAKFDNQWFIMAADITRDGAYDAYDAIALDLFLHGYMAIPQKFV